MASIDFARLRNQTMADGQDSDVTVNTRALIDKVLARYSTEHTTLRELIQNASDAGATTVVIKYETDPSLTTPSPQTSDRSVLLSHIIRHHTLKRLIVSNNGQPFTLADWNRLKSIADGNPDETKIGAFGVGFYSVFADCDEPFVVSGDRTMAFYWKGNTLSTKVATVDQGHQSSDTTFSLDYRQANPASPSYSPSKIPNIPTLCQFLATSLTFVGLQSIELHLDDHKLISFDKKTSPATEIGVPNGLRTETMGRFMRVSHVTRQHSQIDAVWSNVIASAQNPPKRAAELVQAEVRNAGTTLKSFFSKFSSASTPAPPKPKPLPVPEKIASSDDDLSGESKGVIFLQVCTVEVTTHVTSKFAAEIERATKKPPPKKTRVALLTSPYHDTSASLSTGSGSTADLATRIFAEVLPTKSGRIFIGFPTAQTTGFLAHVSAPSLIPTVERENIDLHARNIADWNKELLRVAGLACRITYASEFAELRTRVGQDSMESLIERAVYTFQQFTANASHPSTVLGETMSEAFWNCSKERSIDILSSKGVMASKDVRMPAETLSFLGEVPMVPQELATKAYIFMLSLHERGFISELTMTDIRNGLERRALSEEELAEFLKWCGAKLDSSEIDSAGVRNLFSVTIAQIGGTDEKESGKMLPLGEVSAYINATRLTPTLPVPMDTIPFKFSKSIPLKQLQQFGWVELSMVRWLRFMTTAPQLQEFTTSEKLATQVLTLTSKCWDQLDPSSRATIVNVLTPHPILPTKTGMRTPEEAYFPTVKLFDDLPTVNQFAWKEKFLVALGVRKTVDLVVVFNRMLNQTPDLAGKAPWNHGDLIRYFASVMDEMPKKDLDRLRETAFLPGEGTSVQEQLFKASDLYAPEKSLLDMGLIQVKLPFEFKPSSREGSLLLRLGLKQWPNTATIVKILHHAGQANNPNLYNRTLYYFLGNYFSNSYAAEAKLLSSVTLPILPTEQAPFPALVGPFQCFMNEQAACFGFAILRSDLRPHADKLGVPRDPPIKDCVLRLTKSPPKTKSSAEMQFAYLASRAGELERDPRLLEALTGASIIPIFRKFYLDPNSGGFEDRTRQQTGKYEMRVHHYDAPDAVFVGHDQEFKGILDYVQYGAEATAFLLKAGAKHEPSSHDLAGFLCLNPARFLNNIGQERYLDLLRKLAENSSKLWKDKDLVRQLSQSSALLGYRDIKDESTKLIDVEENPLDDFEEPNMHREWSLNKPNELVIIDDVSYFMRFREYIIAAPQEEVLEEFYARFGVKKISEVVTSQKRIAEPMRDQTSAQQLRKDILERVRLFLHEHERDYSRKSIRHDAKWVESNLIVQCVPDISIRFSLAQSSIALTNKRTAVISKTSGMGTVLYITPKYDLYEVSSELIRQLVQRPKQNDTIALERILTESLRRLREKGINVERILKKKEYEARIAKQQELERKYEQQQHAAEQAKSGVVPATPERRQHDEKQTSPERTPDKTQKMPGAFGGSDDMETDNKRNDNNIFSNFTKNFFKKTPDKQSFRTDGPQMDRDIEATKANIKNAIKDCRPTSMNAIDTKHHRDATELDSGDYCTGEEWENLHKAFTIPYSGCHVNVYYGREQTEELKDIHAELSAFISLIFSLNSVFGAQPDALNIFLDKTSRTVAFNMNQSLFFNLAWFIGVQFKEYNTKTGRETAWDSWFLTFCHELAHNVVADHNARHNWFQQQTAIMHSQKFREALGVSLKELDGK
ncbi:hypothetical protein P280DRAFT_549373 [Massarina eburnea CBS 473.64]|uniref:Sacsin/Nov domain-containing protein n=1 Tax=Massarina eburnea CBS 473.64 TaxID=1395130 RepID=A0A6A6RY74_9PLEO|nr:hypothetical protein P280DRAFT_549373 [Massarina eburnea CBS 473.64]